MEKYNTYKDSGIEWIGEIPEHWEVNKFNRISFFQEGPGLRNWQFTQNGIKVICVTNIVPPNIDFSKYKKHISIEEYEEKYRHFTVNKGDLLLASSGASWGKVSEYKNEETVILNTSTIRLNNNDNNKVIKEFIKWIIQSPYVEKQLDNLLTGSCQPNFGPTHLKQLQCTYPINNNEQTKIANFLEQKTTQIDQLISQKEALLKLYEEEKTAIINQAVTKGINPKVKLKDSGVDWLGEIPVHWDVKKMRYFTKIKTGSKDTENREDFAKYPFYVRSQTIERISTYSFDGEAILTAGDGVGVGKVFHYVNGKFDYHQRVYKVSDFIGIEGKLLFYYMKLNFHKEVMRISAKSTVDSLRLPMLQNFPVCIPPKAEQTKIVNYIETEIKKINTKVTKTKKGIVLLKEYKTALISEVVTGKIKIN